MYTSKLIRLPIVLLLNNNLQEIKLKWKKASKMMKAIKCNPIQKWNVPHQQSMRNNMLSDKTQTICQGRPQHKMIRCLQSIHIVYSSPISPSVDMRKSQKQVIQQTFPIQKLLHCENYTSLDFLVDTVQIELIGLLNFWGKNASQETRCLADETYGSYTFEVVAFSCIFKNLPLIFFILALVQLADAYSSNAKTRKL